MWIGKVDIIFSHSQNRIIKKKIFFRVIDLKKNIFRVVARLYTSNIEVKIAAVLI